VVVIQLVLNTRPSGFQIHVVLEENLERTTHGLVGGASRDELTCPLIGWFTLRRYGQENFIFRIPIRDYKPLL
jgi:hypothetical protein